MSKQIVNKGWSGALVAGDIVFLDECADDIGRYSGHAAEAFIKIGVVLNMARNVFPGDNEFGQWRKERTNIKSAQTANKYMAVARRFGGKEITAKMGISVLSELTSAPEAVIKKVEQIVDEGGTVTNKDVREMKKESAPPTSGEDEPVVAEVDMQEIQSRVVQDTVTFDSAPAAGEPVNIPNLPTSGDYEMIAVTEDEFDIIIDALESQGTVEALAIVARINP